MRRPARGSLIAMRAIHRTAGAHRTRPTGTAVAGRQALVYWKEKRQEIPSPSGPKTESEVARPVRPGVSPFGDAPPLDTFLIPKFIPNRAGQI